MTPFWCSHHQQVTLQQVTFHRMSFETANVQNGAMTQASYTPKHVFTQNVTLLTSKHHDRDHGTFSLSKYSTW